MVCWVGDPAEVKEGCILRIRPWLVSSEDYASGKGWMYPSGSESGSEREEDTCFVAHIYMVT